jgi:hypothetical protein
MIQFDKAKEVVEDILGAKNFIESHQDEIFERLEEFDSRTTNSEGDIMFIAETLPLTSGIVHLGSTADNFKNAKAWVRTNLPDSDTVSILSALTFLYLVDKGWQNFSKSDELTKSGAKRSEVWERICRRTKKVLE